METGPNLLFTLHIGTWAPLFGSVKWTTYKQWWMKKILTSVSFQRPISLVKNRNITGYTNIYPKTEGNLQLGYSRLILLVKNGVQVSILKDIMANDTSSIWVKVIKRGHKKVVIGGIYREHTLLKQPAPNNSNSEANQKERWNKILKQWVEVSKESDCVVIGDINLDSFKWDSPDFINRGMVEATKLEVEAIDFVQLVKGFTRTWKIVETH